MFSLTRYLNRYREAPLEYSFVAKLIIPSGVFDKCDCEQFIYGFMFSRDIYPWSPSRLLRIVRSVVKREPRYGEVIAKNIIAIKECLKTRYTGLLAFERRRAYKLLRYLDRLHSILEHGEPRCSHF